MEEFAKMPNNKIIQIVNKLHQTALDYFTETVTDQSDEDFARGYLKALEAVIRIFDQEKDG